LPEHAPGDAGDFASARNHSSSAEADPSRKPGNPNGPIADESSTWSAEGSKGIDGQLANRIANELAEHVAKGIAEAKRLHRASPKTGKRRSLREISAELDRLGYRNERGEPFNARSIRQILAQ
jgi:hypothetical protein